MTLREGAVDLIVSALRTLPNAALADDVALRESAETLLAIAGNFEIPDEAVHCWIMFRPTWKDWSLQSFRGHCEQYAELRSQLEQRELAALEHDLQPCRRCFSGQALQSIGRGRWWCAKCNEVTL
jgi:hypothetical protein